MMKQLLFSTAIALAILSCSKDETGTAIND
ncbi:MAG: hypothetical protein RIS73_1530, partial [Bacteroidota bacterium]